MIMKQSQMMPTHSAEQAGKEDSVAHARMRVAGTDRKRCACGPLHAYSKLLPLLGTGFRGRRGEGLWCPCRGRQSEHAHCRNTLRISFCAAPGQIRSALDHYSSASQVKLKTGYSQVPRSGNEHRRLPSALTPQRGRFWRRPDREVFQSRYDILRFPLLPRTEPEDQQDS
jgi:hypothetical protein